MKKAILISLLVLVAFSTAAIAQEFKDVPSGHWAESAVYKLVKLGVTKGYPDGTFRGNKTISRYEAATLISNLANAVGAGLSDADREKLKEEIKNEILSEAGLGWKTDGYYHVRGILTGLAGSNARALARNHRLNLTISNTGLVKGSTFALHWDTRTMAVNPRDVAAGNALGLLAVDYMNWGAYDFAAATNFDLYGKINFAELGVLPDYPITLEASTGLGDQFHRGDMVKGTIGIKNLSVGGAYSRLNGVTSGTAGINKYSLLAGYSLTAPGLGPTEIAFEGNAYNSTISPFAATAARAYNMKVTVTSQPLDYLKIQGIFGLTGKSSSGIMLGGKLWLSGLLDNKLNVYAGGYKIASGYLRASMERFVDQDVLDYMVADAGGNSETHIEGKVNYAVNSLIGIQFRASLQLDGGGLGTLAWSAWEPRVIISPSKRAQIYGAYRIWRNHAAGTNMDRLETGMKVNI